MATRKAGRVGIVYSENVHYSSESKSMAHYFSEGPISDLTSSRRIVYYPPNGSKVAEVPAADVQFAHWSALPECHLVVVTVNPNDTEACGNQLSELLQNHKARIPVFSIQRGVKYGTSLTDEVETKGITVIEAVAGFGVVIEPKHSAFVATTRVPSIVYQRLSKEEVKIADLPLRLLETMEINTSFRKFLTPHAWGLYVYETLCIVNILTKGSLMETISNRDYRMICALLVRETIEVLKSASKGGAWTPDMLLVNSWMTPKIFELVLVLPNPLFNLVGWWFDLLPRPNVISPGQFDLMENRKTMAVFNMKELVDVAHRNKTAVPLCEAVLNVLMRVEAAQDVHVGSRSYGGYHNADLISEIARVIPTIYNEHDSVAEMKFWLTRFAAAVSIFFALIFLLYHD